MILYNESINLLKEVAKNFPKTDIEEVSLLQAVGRILAEDVVARENNPPFDNSAMDGFAINIAFFREHLASSQEWIPVQSIISAGDTDFHFVNRQAAIEIMTGAPIPDPDFDAVVRVEDVELKSCSSGQKFIRIKSNPLVGDNIRRAGEDTKTGDTLLSKGERITNEHLLVLATQGISRLKVKKQIKVAILSTGKEIASYKTKRLRFGQIRNSTGIYLEAALTNQSIEVKNYGIVEDDPLAYIQQLNSIFNDGVDILISTGAVSMGVFDFVRPALESIGAKIHFHKCAIRPGKPILFASTIFKNKTKFIFGVPGNPISTAVGLKFFIKPFIDLILTGKTEKPNKAILSFDTKKPHGFKCFYKARLNLDGVQAKVESLKGQASFMVSPLIQSNAWVVLPEEGTYIKQGTQVEVFTI
ncbi:MAG: molybdopterin molybdotransferase MoeA [Oligoflexia bacterium]|nr:molybdopterin molybdotransferase MoeA [Oligoflexia bacterium]